MVLRGIGREDELAFSLVNSLSWLSTKISNISRTANVIDSSTFSNKKEVISKKQMGDLDFSLTNPEKGTKLLRQASLILLVRASRHICNRYGNIGSPCLNPLVCLNSSNYLPLIKTEEEALETQSIKRLTT